MVSTLSVPVALGEHVQHVLETLPTPKPASLPVQNPSRAFWTHSAPDANPLAKEGSAGTLVDDADVCIIGSGITGVSAAYHLANAVKANANLGPLKAVIVDARDFCRNGGHLASHNFLEYTANVAAFGPEDARRAVDIENYVVSELVRLIKTEGLENAVDLVEAGRTVLLFTEAEEAATRADHAAAEAAGVDVSTTEWLSKEDVEARYGATYPGVRLPANNLWPLKLVTELFRLARNATPSFELRLHTHTPATAVAPSAQGSRRRWTVATPRGAIACAYVIHATNGYASHLLPQLAGPAGIVPTRGQILATRANATAAALGTSGFAANEGFEYWFPRPVADPTKERPLVIVGGGREAAEAPDFLPGVFPGKYAEGAEPEMEWTGIMGFTSLGDPFVGPVLDKFDGSGRGSAYEGQYIAAGYTGHGMPRAYACAEVVAGMVAAQLEGREWAAPGWLPLHYLTTQRAEARTREELIRARG
ncbi:FAD dependent oxidoreductase-domain-containing protein [Amylostereum chailletii]|nr:FAD dependent oxidoreductase-domain-containing protein [Amylostereum chailletii]